jgi:hypothetical protein
MAKAIRIGARTCDVNAHFNFVTATVIDVRNGDPEHVIDVIPYFSKLDIEDMFYGIKLVGSKMPLLLGFFPYVCAWCGRRCTQWNMHIGLTYFIVSIILEIILVSNVTEIIKRPSLIRLSTSSNKYAIQDSYIGKTPFDICNVWLG